MPTALAWLLRHLQPGAVGLCGQIEGLEVLLLGLRERDRWRFHADLVGEDAARERHAGVVAAASRGGLTYATPVKPAGSTCVSMIPAMALPSS